MAKRSRIGKTLVFRTGHDLGGDLFGQGRAARNRVAIAEPPREIAVAAALRTERRMFGLAWFAADRARLRISHRPQSGHDRRRWQCADRP